MVSPTATIAEWRPVVLAFAIVATTIKLIIAARTFGTNDVHLWTQFSEGMREFGPVHIYGNPFAEQYNHPPLAALMLLGINLLTDHGIGTLPFLIRVPASLADIGTALLVLELVGRTTTPRRAALAALAVCASPALFTISGFHGNTDPVFVLFVLLTVFLVVRDRPLLAGLAFAAALSVKIVPIVVAPVLLVMLLRAGRRHLPYFLLGGAALLVPLWAPALVGNFTGFTQNVLGYAGIALREWGLPKLLDAVDAPQSLRELVNGPGRFLAVAVSALVPAALLWRRPQDGPTAAALTLALFLLLSPAFGMQYTVWPLAAAYLVTPAVGHLYNVVASVFVLDVYDDWNNARPWDWYEGVAKAFRPRDMVLMSLTWAALACVVAVGLWTLLRPARTAPHSPWTTGRHRPPVPVTAAR